MSAIGINAHGMFRHNVVNRPGLWLQNLSADLQARDQWARAQWHVHAHCVVDDFGNLVPVQIEGMTANRELFNSGDWKA